MIIQKLFTNSMQTSLCLLLSVLILNGMHTSKALAQACVVSSQCYYDCYFCDTISLPLMENAIEATVDAQHNTTQNLVTNEHTDTKDHVSLSHSQLRAWMSSELFTDTASVHLQDMATQAQAISAASVRSLGTFFDAQNHIQTQTLLSSLSAQAHKDYIPSGSVCVFGTATSKIALAESNTDLTQHALAQNYIERITGEVGSSGSSSHLDDLVVRTKKFKEIYCDPKDNDGRLSGATVCSTGGEVDRYNNDLKYSFLVDGHKTLDIDFSDGTITKDEQDLTALSNNLYSHHLLSRPKDFELTYVANKKIFMQTRELFAKRSVVNNSFNKIVSMKAPTLKKDAFFEVYENMGMLEDEVPWEIGENPSYYAQMEILTKKLYQNPMFYTHLIDTPASVQRQQAVMQSVELMQTRDLYESLVRSEMMLSVLLEATLRGTRNRTDFDLLSLKENQISE